MGRSTLSHETHIPETPLSDEHFDIEHHLTVRMGLVYGRFVYRFRWLIVALWIIMLIAGTLLALRVPDLLKGGGIELSNSESRHVSDILTHNFKQPPSTTIVLFQSEHTPVSDPAYQLQIKQVSARINSFQNLKSITQGPVGKDGRTTYLLVAFDQDL